MENHHIKAINSGTKPKNMIQRKAMNAQSLIEKVKLYY